MSSRWAYRTRHFLGFGVSVLVHLGLLLAVLGWVRTPGEVEGEGSGRPVAVNLAMFQSTSPQEEAEVTPAEQPLEEAEPLPEPVPESAAQPQQEAVQEPEPEPVEAFETAPEPATEPKPKPEPKPQQKSKPKPKPQPAAKTKPKPKPQPAAKPKPKPAATAQAPAAAPAESTASAAASAGNKPDSGSGAQPSTPKKKPVAAIERQYLEGLRRAIERNKFYPRRARRRGDAGEALVAFVVQADGRITNVEVRRSSGSKLLDKAAKDALEKLARYQPIPEALGRKRWPLRVPINFALD